MGVTTDSIKHAGGHSASSRLQISCTQFLKPAIALGIILVILNRTASYRFDSLLFFFTVHIVIGCWLRGVQILERIMSEVRDMVDSTSRRKILRREEAAQATAELLDKSDIAKLEDKMYRNMLWEDVDEYRKILLAANKRDRKGVGVDLELTPLMDEDGRIDELLLTLKQEKDGWLYCRNFGLISRSEDKKYSLTAFLVPGMPPERYKPVSTTLPCVTEYLRGVNGNRTPLAPFR